MSRRKPAMTTLVVLAIIALLDLALLISGYRILVQESRGEEWSEGDFEVRAVKLGETLSCTYYTGRSLRTVTTTPETSGLDECPFIIRPPRETAFGYD